MCWPLLAQPSSEPPLRCLSITLALTLVWLSNFREPSQDLTFLINTRTPQILLLTTTKLVRKFTTSAVAKLTMLSLVLVLEARLLVSPESSRSLTRRSKLSVLTPTVLSLLSLMTSTRKESTLTRLRVSVMISFPEFLAESTLTSGSRLTIRSPSITLAASLLRRVCLLVAPLVAP